MNKINSMRAKLLFEKFYKDENPENFTFNVMIHELFTLPSFTDVECCSTSSKNCIVIQLNNEIFKNDFSNLQQAIEKNEIPICNRCKKAPALKRVFGNQILVDVR